MPCPGAPQCASAGAERRPGGAHVVDEPDGTGRRAGGDERTTHVGRPVRRRQPALWPIVTQTGERRGGGQLPPAGQRLGEEGGLVEPARTQPRPGERHRYEHGLAGRGRNAFGDDRRKGVRERRPTPIFQRRDDRRNRVIVCNGEAERLDGGRALRAAVCPHRPRVTAPAAARRHRPADGPTAHDAHAVARKSAAGAGGRYDEVERTEDEVGQSHLATVTDVMSRVARELCRNARDFVTADRHPLPSAAGRAREGAHALAPHELSGDAGTTEVLRCARF